MADAESKLWAFSGLVVCLTDKGAIVERATSHIPGVVLARSRDEAIGKAYRILCRLYPVAAGFQHHSVNVHDVAEVLDPESASLHLKPTP